MLRFRARDLIDRIAGREERHYSVSALHWITTFFGSKASRRTAPARRSS